MHTLLQAKKNIFPPNEINHSPSLPRHNGSYWALVSSHYCGHTLSESWVIVICIFFMCVHVVHSSSSLRLPLLNY